MKLLYGGLTHWPCAGSSRLVARLSRFRPASPWEQIVHRDGIRRRNYVSRKYSLIIPRPSALENEYRHTFPRDYLSSARGNDPRPATSARIYITYSYSEGNDQVKKREREVNGSFVMFQLVFRKFLRRPRRSRWTRKFQRDGWLIEITSGFLRNRDLIVYLVLTVLRYTVH